MKILIDSSINQLMHIENTDETKRKNQYLKRNKKKRNKLIPK